MKNVIAGEDVEIAIRTGKKEIVVGPEDIITSIAHEIAEKAGIRIVISEAPLAEESLKTSFSTDPGPSTFEEPGLITNIESETGVQQWQGLVSDHSKIPPFDMGYWRRQFPILDQYLHVANCSQAPQSTFTRNAAMEYLDSWDQMGMDWERWMEEIHYAKKEFGQLINAGPDDIAVGTSVSELTSAVARSLPLDTNRKKVVVTLRQIC
jgi:hypothetical protein